MEIYFQRSLMKIDMTKIVLIGPVYPYRGGIAHFTANLAQTIQENGYNLTVISFSRQYPKWLYPGKDDKDLSSGRSAENVEYIFSPLNPIDWLRTIRRIKELNPDLVILQWWTTFWSFATHALLSSLKKASIPTKVIIHNAFPHEGKKVDKLLAKYALNKATRFVVMNTQEEKKIGALIKGAVLQFVPLPIYRPFDAEVMSKSDARKKLGLDESKNIGLFFGFVRPYKGLGVLLDAIKILKDEGKIDAYCFVIAGEFWHDKKQYMDTIKAHGIEDYIIVRDEYIPDDQAGVYFQAADFFIAPYTAGTQSGALKMAMAYGLPCISSSAIAQKENKIFEGLFLFETENGAKLAQSISDLLFLRSFKPQYGNLNSSESQDDFMREILTTDNCKQETTYGK